jgi:hypothetical protein
MESGEIALVVVGLGVVCFLGFLAFLTVSGRGAESQSTALRQTPEQYFGGWNGR